MQESLEPGEPSTPSTRMTITTSDEGSDSERETSCHHEFWDENAGRRPSAPSRRDMHLSSRRELLIEFPEEEYPFPEGERVSVEADSFKKKETHSRTCALCRDPQMMILCLRFTTRWVD